MATLFWDVTEIQQCHPPQNIPHCVEKIKGFTVKAKFFWDTATYQKLHCKGGGVHQPTPPPPLYHSGGLCVCPRVMQWPNGHRQADNDWAKLYGILQMLESSHVQSNGAKNQNLVFWLNWDSAKNFKQKTLEYLTTVLYHLYNNIVPIMLCLIIPKLSWSIVPPKSYKPYNYYTIQNNSSGQKRVK